MLSVMLSVELFFAILHSLFGQTKNPHDSHQTGLSCGFWRRWRDSNSRARFQTYSLSRGAPSPTWVHLQMGGAFRIFSCGGDVGGESGIRTHGSFESPVFKTGSLNHSDTSPRWALRPAVPECVNNIIISCAVCQEKNRPCAGFLFDGKGKRRTI